MVDVFHDVFGGTDPGEGGASGSGSGLTPLGAVAVATTANITLADEQTIDGVLTSTVRVLVKDQTDLTENGIYVSGAGAWSRSVDADQDGELAQGTFVFVTGGDTQVAQQWSVTSPAGDAEIGVDEIVWGLTGTSSIAADDITDATSDGIALITSADANPFTDDDESKLDGIEALADVTDATNVAAAGALMDSEVTNLAAVKAFDAADYATAAQGTLADSAQQPPSEGAFVDGDKTKLDAIEALADVTDETNVLAALDGAVTAAITPASGDKILALDASNADNLKHILFSSFGGSGIAWNTPVDADVVPDGDGTRDIGSAANRFAEVHADALLVADKVVLTIADDAAENVGSVSDGAGGEKAITHHPAELHLGIPVAVPGTVVSYPPVDDIPASSIPVDGEVKWRYLWPAGLAAATTLTFTAVVTFTVATTGTATVAVALKSHTGDAAAYDTVNSDTVTIPGTVGDVATLTITLTNDDSLAADDVAYIHLDVTTLASGNMNILGAKITGV